MARTTLSLVPSPGPITEPPNRGRLMTAADVAAELFPPGTKPDYITRHVEPRVKLSERRIYWYESDVRMWLEKQRETRS